MDSSAAPRNDSVLGGRRNQGSARALRWRARNAEVEAEALLGGAARWPGETQPTVSGRKQGWVYLYARGKKKAPRIGTD